MVFVSNEKWGYNMKPFQNVYTYGHVININSFGLRGPEIQKFKSPGKSRILFIGNSITYGGGSIKEEDLFCRIVESLLKNINKLDVEVINLSVPGWSPKNWIKYIEAKGLFNTDLVVLILPECDLGRQFCTISTYNFREKTRVFRFQKIFLKTYYIIKHKVFNSEEKFTENDEFITKKTIEDNRNCALKLIELCNDNNIHFLAVFIPSFSTSYSYFKKYWPQFESIMPNLLDLRNELKNANLFIDGTHLNLKGHRLVAEKIYNEIVKYYDK